MSGNIFVSYRRGDSRHAAGRLVDHLENQFSTDQLFMDVDSIELGLDFVQVIEERVASCEVMLVIIGPRWISAQSPSGARRLDDPNDFVRLEIETALKRDIRVIPVLVDGAELPAPEDLPESLAAMSRRQATRISHESFPSDARTLAEALASIVDQTDLPMPDDIAVEPLPQNVVPSLPPKSNTHAAADFDDQTDDKRYALQNGWPEWIVALTPVWLFGFMAFLINVVGFRASDFRIFLSLSSDGNIFLQLSVVCLIVFFLRRIIRGQAATWPRVVGSLGFLVLFGIFVSEFLL